MTRACTGFLNRLSPLALLAFCGVAFGQNAVLRITEPALSKDGTIVTSQPAISLKGTLTSAPGDRRVLWESNRGFSDLATVTDARDGSLEWTTASPVPLRANMGSLTGVSATGFTGLGTNTLTWTFGGIANSNGALALALSSAIASAGGPLTGPNTSFSIKVLQGDFNDDGFVSVADALLVGAAQSASYNIFADINGDGVVNVSDVNLVRSLIGGSNP